jgi:hypothetical protein
MNRNTLLAGALFAGVLVVAIFVLRSPEKGTRTGEGPRPIPKIAAGDVDALEVTKDGKTTVIKRAGSGFQVTSPLAYPADAEAAKQAFEAIEKLEFGNIITEQKAKHDEFEVGSNGLRVVAKKADKVLADLWVGKVGSSQTMVRPEGKDEVWQAIGTLKWQFDKDTSAWRDKSLTTFEENDAERLEVVSKTGGRIVLERPAKADGGAETEWRVVESSMKVEPFDKTVATGMISALYAWKANDFADDATPEETGLDAPDLMITVTVKGGQKQRVLIGKKKDDEDFYVKREETPQVFLVKKYNLERINKRPIEFRDKTLCDLSDGEITEVAVNHDKESFTLAKDPSKSGDEAWKLAKPAGANLDTSKVSSILWAFREWKANSFAEESSPKVTGLDKPKATIVAKSNVKGHGCTLKVGAELQDKQNHYVAAAGSPDVFVVAKWSLDRVMQKVEDLKQK